MKTKQIMALLFGLLIAATTSADLVLVSNTCDNTTGWTDNGSPTTLTIQDDSSGIGDGNAMKYATTGKNNQWAELGLGQTVTLGVSDYISLAMDVRFTGDRNSPSADNNSIRWMFMNPSDSLLGTGIGVNPGNNTGLDTWFQAETAREGSKFDHIDMGTTAHSILLTMTRKDDGAGSYMQYSYSIDGGAAIVRDGGIVASPTDEFSFDAILLGSHSIDDGSGTQGFDGLLYDNVVATTSVPEPATIGMLGLAGVVVTALRRLRR